MDINSDPKHPKNGNRGELWSRKWNGITYALLAVPVAICLVDAETALSFKAAAVALSCLWGVWFWLFVTRDRFRSDYPAVGVVALTLSISVAALLSWINMAFVVLLFAYFGISFRALPVKWAVPNVVLASTVLAVRYMNFSDGWFTTGNLLFLLGFLTMAFLASMLGLFVSSIARQSIERQRMIKELESTRGELAKAEREAGVLQERQRLAGEIHDTLAQGFTSVILQLETAELDIDSNPPKARIHLERALRAARDSLVKARSVLWALRPDILEREPLKTVLDRTARTWGESTGIRAEVNVAEDIGALPPEVEAVLVRAAQEALANVHKHAEASCVNITLSFIGDAVILDVRDNGRGFSISSQADKDGRIPKGYGIPAMRERAELLGGRVTVETSPGEGTTLVVEIPLQRSGKETST